MAGEAVGFGAVLLVHAVVDGEDGQAGGEVEVQALLMRRTESP